MPQNEISIINQLKFTFAALKSRGSSFETLDGCREHELRSASFDGLDDAQSKSSGDVLDDGSKVSKR